MESVMQTAAPSHQCVQDNQVWKQKAHAISVWEERAIRRLALAIVLPFAPLEPLRRSEPGVLLRLAYQDCCKSGGVAPAVSPYYATLVTVCSGWARAILM
jgi:hypothetical protein